MVSLTDSLRNTKLTVGLGTENKSCRKRLLVKKDVFWYNGMNIICRRDLKMPDATESIMFASFKFEQLLISKIQFHVLVRWRENKDLINLISLSYHVYLHFAH